MKNDIRNISLQSIFPEVVGNSDSLLGTLDLVTKVAMSDCSVLIKGESGTGKELIARAIHRLSTRAHQPFLALNCSAIPENLLESELFGHEKGSYTGADRKHLGVFERANGGTLFLDEIGDMAINLQAKLLRVLQEKKFTPVGGVEQRKADVRIIAATNVNLQQAMQRNQFRADLYYRINVLPVELSPLRDRPEDILPLLRHYLELSNRIHARQEESQFDPTVIHLLQGYEWPGNIRQLQNVVERMVVMSGGGLLGKEHLPPEVLQPTNHVVYHPEPLRATTPSPSIIEGARSLDAPKGHFTLLPMEGVDLETYVERIENELIRQALERTGNNKNQAAKLLGLNRTTLVERLKKRKLSATE